MNLGSLVGRDVLGSVAVSEPLELSKPTREKGKKNEATEGFQ
jgi:hypothetical protein